jgi:hypothetical protein
MVSSFKENITFHNSCIFIKTIKMEDFQTIAIFNYSHEIVVLKHILDQDGIHYFFENETTLSVAPFYSAALGGIKLKVHPNDFQAVQDILDDLNNNLRIV